ncbi:MAG: dihydrolipoyl dehydrogenase [Candidatus Ancaeobacter aquaticus]|nr:dihydrolipoyl dehydrogenase [Candidatus Ancaeobacter aquaticus]
MYDYDIAIIGGGPAGYAAAIHAGKNGLKTVLIEKDALGGTCLNRGCIPTKYLINHASTLRKTKDNPFITNKENIGINYPEVISSKNLLVSKISNNVQGVVKSAGVDIKNGLGLIIGDNEVSVTYDSNQETLTTKYILIATGSKPSEIPGVETDEKTIFSSTGILNNDKIPASLAIIGGGAIGCEFAYIYACMGVKVTIIEMCDHILPYEDMVTAKTLETSLKKLGVKIITKIAVKDVLKSADSVKISFAHNEDIIDVEKVLLSTGRVGVCDEVCSAYKDTKFISVNNIYQTDKSHIYAIGDVNGKSMYAHGAYAQGIAVIDRICNMNKDGENESNEVTIPRCVYTHPQVASVGINEKEAKEKGIAYDIARCPFALLGKAQAIEATEGFYKIIYDKESKIILGVTIVGEEATDLIGEALVLVSKKMTIEELSKIIHPHPTLTEGYWEAAQNALGLSIHMKAR